MSLGQPELTLRVEGMTCDGCAAAVTRTIRRLDPDATVAVDRPAGRVVIRTSAAAHEIARALGEASYAATASG